MVGEIDRNVDDSKFQLVVWNFGLEVDFVRKY